MKTENVSVTAQFGLSPVSASVEAIAEKMQQHWQGGGHAYTRPWNNGTDKDCVHGLPGQAEFFRELARIATAGFAQTPAVPNVRDIADEDMRELLSAKDVGRGRAILKRILRALSDTSTDREGK